MTHDANVNAVRWDVSPWATAVPRTDTVSCLKCAAQKGWESQRDEVTRGAHFSAIEAGTVEGADTQLFMTSCFSN